MTGSTARSLLVLFNRHPWLGVLCFVACGLAMTADSIRAGTYKARFLDGPRVVATVVELRGREMTASWRDPSGKEFVGNLALGKRSKVKLADSIDLVLAPDDHGQAILAARLETDRPIRFLGVAATPLVFGGLGLVLLGIFYPRLEAHLQKAREP